MHAGSLTSPRLQRVLSVLSAGGSYTTRQIVQKSGVMAASTCISELRAHGAEIDCTARFVKGKRRFFYTLKRGPR